MWQDQKIVSTKKLQNVMCQSDTFLEWLKHPFENIGGNNLSSFDLNPNKKNCALVLLIQHEFFVKTSTYPANSNMTNVSMSARKLGHNPKKIITRAAAKKTSIELETVTPMAVTTKAIKDTQAPKIKSKSKVANPKLVKPKSVKSKAKESGESGSDGSDSEFKSKGWSFIREDYERIHSWLDSKENSESVFSRSGKTPIGKRMKTPKEGWTELARLLNRESRGRLSLDARSMKERFKQYKKKYRLVKLLPLSTGAGITSEDRRKGIYTIMAKCESMCPLYSKMDERFSEKANVTPLGEICMNGTSYIWGIDDFDNVSDNESNYDGSFDGQDWESVTYDDDYVNGHQVESNYPAVQDCPGDKQINSISLLSEEIEQLSDQHVEKSTIEWEQQGKQKRPLSDESADPSKRSRAKDTCKAPPKLDTGTVLQSRNSIGSAMIESSTVKAGGKV